MKIGDKVETPVPQGDVTYDVGRVLEIDNETNEIRVRWRYGRIDLWEHIDNVRLIRGES